MTDIDDTTEQVDGRVARRERNVNAVIDVVLELFAEDSMFPTIEQAAGLACRFDRSTGTSPTRASCWKPQ